jgi:hypothetical protein
MRFIADEKKCLRQIQRRIATLGKKRGPSINDQEQYKSLVDSETYLKMRLREHPMTPAPRARNSAQKWLKISAQEMIRIAKNLELTLGAFGEKAAPIAQKIITDLRQQAKRCAHHGLGIGVQELLPLKPKE